MSKKKGCNVMKKFLVVVLAMSMLMACLTGCGGSKATYTSLVKEMNTQTKGTFTYDIFLEKENSDGIKTDVTANIERGISDTTEYLNMQIKLSDKDSVTLNSVVVDGIRYLNLQDLRSSLQNCTDETLLTFGNSAPVNIGFVSCEDNVVKFSSLFAETEELADAGFTGVTNFDGRLDLLVDMFLSICESNGALSYTNKDKIYSVTGTDKLPSVIQSFIRNSGTYYDKYTANLTALNLASEYELSEGFVNQKDNFVSSLTPIWQSYEIGVTPTVTLVGDIDKYEGETTGIEFSGTFSMSWTDMGDKYTMSVKYGTKQSASVVTKPDGTNVDVDTFVNEYFDITQLTKVLLNKFNLTPWNLSDTRLIYEDDVFKASVSEDMEKYLGIDSDVSAYMQENAGSEQATKMLTLIDEITGGLRVVVQDEVEEEQQRYQTIEGYLENGLEYEATVNEELSTSSIVVVDIRLLNPTEDTVSVKTSKFSLRDLGTTKVSANIEARLLEIQPDFDTSAYVEKVELFAGAFQDTKLYFVVPEESGYFDLYLDDTPVGNLIAF